ncbi:hypothetical protein KU39_3p204 (plasmid) [Piscirickettsia salmonis]|uniref:Uncharacterized protein n=1 Tax=Piscirickettsia salmonis TaxID=1238 RepID=A0AAC8VLN6_PISSA|nr:hypothetical protein KU39_3p204 [Piscirickettsia salmonis]
MTKAEMIQAIHENNSDLKEQFVAYQKEARVNTRWLIGIGITLIIGVAALIIKTHF